MKKLSLSLKLTIVGLFLMTPCAMACAIVPEPDPEEGGVRFDHDSRICITLDISSLGTGRYGYTISFINKEPSDLWDFVVWTEHTASSIYGSFERRLSISLDQVFEQLDARNLYPDLCWLNGMYYPSSNGFQTAPDAGLPFKGKAFFYFEAGFLETSFLYGYQTLESGHAGSNGGFFAGGGVVSCKCKPVPLPPSLLLLGSALLGLAGLKRRFLRP